METLNFIYKKFPESKGRIDDKSGLTWNQIATLLEQSQEAPETIVSVPEGLAIGHCEKCNELTPQAYQTVGTCCQVCLSTNENAVSDITYQWLADFWKSKYYKAIEFGTVTTQP